MYSLLKEKSSHCNNKNCVLIFTITLLTQGSISGISWYFLQVQLQTITTYNAKINEVIVLGPKVLSNLTQKSSASSIQENYDINGTFSIWKVLKKSGMISLQDHSHLKIYVDGFYHINAQMQIDYTQILKKNSFHLCKNDEIVASKKWSSSYDTGAISTVVYAKNGDRFSLYSPWQKVKWFLSDRVTFFSVYYLGS